MPIQRSFSGSWIPDSKYVPILESRDFELAFHQFELNDFFVFVRRAFSRPQMDAVRKTLIKVLRSLFLPSKTFIWASFFWIVAWNLAFAIDKLEIISCFEGFSFDGLIDQSQTSIRNETQTDAIQMDYYKRCWLSDLKASFQHPKNLPRLYNDFLEKFVRWVILMTHIILVSHKYDDRYLIHIFLLFDLSTLLKV